MNISRVIVPRDLRADIPEFVPSVDRSRKFHLIRGTQTCWRVTRFAICIRRIDVIPRGMKGSIDVERALFLDNSR